MMQTLKKLRSLKVRTTNGHNCRYQNDTEKQKRMFALKFTKFKTIYSGDLNGEHLDSELI